jgi:hypothetical protein
MDLKSASVEMKRAHDLPPIFKMSKPKLSYLSAFADLPV